MRSIQCRISDVDYFRLLCGRQHHLKQKVYALLRPPKLTSLDPPGRSTGSLCGQETQECNPPSIPPQSNQHASLSIPPENGSATLVAVLLTAQKAALASAKIRPFLMTAAAPVCVQW